MGQGCLPYLKPTHSCPSTGPSGQEDLTLTHLVTLNIENPSMPGMSELTWTLGMREF